METPVPTNELDRLTALRACHILDTPREPAFDDIVELLRSACHAPMAAVTLIDETRQWFKATAGFDATEAPRSMAFCSHTILQKDPLVVADATADPRFANNEYVTSDFHVRAYAGAPLLSSDGYALGSLCMVDVVERTFTASELKVLEILARQTAAQLELKRHIAHQSDLIDSMNCMRQTLDETAARFRSSLDAIREGFAITDDAGRVVTLSRSTGTLLGLNTEAIAGTRLFESLNLILENGSRLDIANNPVELTRRDGIARYDEPIGVRVHGEFRWISINSVSLDQIAPLPRAVVATFTDITERKIAEEEHGLLAAIVACSDDAVTAVDLDGIVLSWNAGAERMYGIPARDIINRHASILAPAEEKAFITTLLKRVADGDCIEPIEVRRRRGDGAWITVSLVVSAISNASGRIVGAAIMGRDVSTQIEAADQLRDYSVALEFQNYQLGKTNSELEEANSRLQALATTDGLTGLMNHRAFHEALDSEVRCAQLHRIPLSVVMIDVDCFKPYNDCYGHPAGDRVLQQLSDIVSKTVRDRDIAGRYGGEEFALVLPETALREAVAVAERLRAAIEAARWPHRAITISVGVSSLCAEIPGSLSLIAGADRALYVSKGRGRNCVSKFDGTPETFELPAALADTKFSPAPP